MTNQCKFCKNTLKSSKNIYCSINCQHGYQMRERDRKLEAGEALSELVLKRYLIDKHGERCLDPLCAWDFSKRPIGVELEHIDGNADNNVLKNCTLLCPNCHSQTSTYKAKNKGNGRAARRKQKS